MNNKELREILIKELGIDGLPEEAQDEIVAKLGEVILKSLTVAIFEKLSNGARTEFERISAKGDHAMIQEFLEENVPDLHTLMEEEVRRTLQSLAEKEQSSE
ncbi:MAG: hypothetical protein A2747_00660 [Candidatus Yonathbacteria bacterium RIFCSPHIGHO2_01_FULL_44_41]|uniref:Uncharacterized protein n=1 Tax=Candidatus Yonathbacteria bacterium RIFCSPHIGHO2_02_FULL_44_14 TaxID=1802724 RepID=A0A1G2S5Z4_9BACT|nr:MAG: hypothetical protein A2747_00660 [Candidatus Yonathbacteria bacterium RIFCSPHIGHO2_01_FULL_44_41]OHA80407.1 MAG: hypothetical protein A3D51_01100 [Candidatus Yonathbacteria bacterium RIFCSPHIGHO2_02_FULL_44_14]OHA80730.1 MAG: hypothetical protein A3B06_00030 [Candidatus Yonathbacteria bacterium RIFCSPLOWO2_01_FULL_43_20]